ncbi:MAG: four helix bundle protein [Flavobacteriaceae bacterium]|nr:four helix bundle protein [Flavobacteriaceae bacterium]
MASFNGFEELECWKKARVLRNDIKELIKSFPKNEKFELISQMRRASRSITHNIAEGFGRFHYQENIQFCRIARGSLYELLDQLITAFDEEYILENKYQKFRKQVFECLAILNGYINYLKQAKNSD